MHKPVEGARGFLKVILIVTAIGIFTVVLGFLLFFSFRDLLTGNTLAIIPLLLGGYTVYVLIRRGVEMRRLAEEGVETTGTVTRKLMFFFAAIKSSVRIPTLPATSTIAPRLSRASSMIVWRLAVP